MGPEFKLNEKSTAQGQRRGPGEGPLPQVAPLPTMFPVPRSPWLASVNVRDVATRIDEVKTRLTSIFGRFLKMDSTKKVSERHNGSDICVSL